MKKQIEFAVFVGLVLFVLLCPLGLAFAVAIGIGSMVLGAWAVNDRGVAALLFLVLALVLGVIFLVSTCIGLAPGAGTLAFGAGVPSVVLTLPSYGSGRAEFSLWTLWLPLIPSLIGALLAILVRRGIGELEVRPPSLSS